MPIRTGHVVVAALLAVVGAAPPSPAAAQEDRSAPRLLVTGWSGFSMREGQRAPRVGDDLVAFGARVTVHRRMAPNPWVQVDRFRRPDLQCLPDAPCNDTGIAARAGVMLPLSEDDTAPGLHPRLIGGLGVGVSAETTLAYMLGIGAAWGLHPRLAPVFEARWERIPGVRAIFVIGLGLRTGIL